MINKVIVSGNLTRDPEIRVTPNGSSVCQFTIATTKSWKDDNGQDREETAFIDVVAWGKTGEIIGKWFGKGGLILVHGKIKMDTWDDKQSGQKRQKLKVDCSWPEGGFEFQGRNRAGEGGGNGGGGGGGGGGNQGGQYDEQGEQPNSFERPRNAPPPRGNQRPPQNDVDDDVPF